MLDAEQMEQEYKELVQRNLKICDFLWTDKFKALPDYEKELLIRQRAFMMGYEETLSTRLAYFE